MTLKKVVLRGLLGIILGTFFGTVITIVISLSVGTGEYFPTHPDLIKYAGSDLNAYIIQFFMSGILGATFAAASTIFEVESWGFTKQTILHFFITSFVMLPLAYFLYWMEHSLAGALLYFAIFLVMYLVIWIIQYTFWKNRIRELNNKLKNR